MRLIPIGRLFSNEQSAQAAVNALVDAGFDPKSIGTMNSNSLGSPGSREAMIGAIIDNYTGNYVDPVPRSHARVYAEGIEGGGTLVLVTAPFGQGLRASSVLDSQSPQELNWPERPVISSSSSEDEMSGTPLSDFMRWNTLSEDDNKTYLTERLKTERPHLTESLGLLNDNPTPLSSAIGLSLLSRDQSRGEYSMGMRLLIDAPEWLSSRIGFNTLSRETPAERTTSFGMPLVIDNPTPLSSFFGLRTLSGEPADQSSSER